MKNLRPLDTTPEAYEIQLQIFRKMTPAQRLQIGSELSQFSRKLLASGVKLRHPEYTDDEVLLGVIRLELGEDLFLKVYPFASHILP